MSKGKMIGIVGGMGPYAGLHLVEKIFDNTLARGDQEHLSVALLSVPGQLADRTEFLLGRSAENPGQAIAKVIRRLEEIGARVIGIPCNTAHAPPIYRVIVNDLKRARRPVCLVNMLEEVSAFLRAHHAGIRKVGVLATAGTYQMGMYQDMLARGRLNAIVPGQAVQESVHRAIYDAAFGIKARANPVTAKARGILLRAVDHLRRKGAQAVIFACTEIPLAVPERRLGRTIIIDPAVILARALIRAACPQKLAPPWRS